LPQRAGEIQRVLLQLEVVLGDGEPALEAAQLEIIAGDLGHQADHHAAVLVDGRVIVGRGRFDLPAGCRRRRPAPSLRQRRRL